MKTLCKLTAAALGGALVFLLALGAALTHAGQGASEAPWCGVPVVEEADVGCTGKYDGKRWAYPGNLDQLYGQRTVSPEFRLRPSLSDHRRDGGDVARRRVSPEFRLRPSLSAAPA